MIKIGFCNDPICGAFVHCLFAALLRFELHLGVQRLQKNFFSQGCICGRCLRGGKLGKIAHWFLQSKLKGKQMNIYVAQPSMPKLDEFMEEIRSLWESRTLT